MNTLLTIVSLAFSTSTLQPPAPPLAQVSQKNTSFSLDFQNAPLSTALVKVFRAANVPFAFSEWFAEPVTLQLKDVSLETAVQRIADLFPQTITIRKEQSVWCIRSQQKRAESLRKHLTLRLENTPLDVALGLLQDALPRQKFIVGSFEPMPRVTYYREQVLPQQALADILKLVGPPVMTHLREDGTLEIRLRDPGSVKSTGELMDIDFRNATLKDAITVIVQQARLDNIVIQSGMENTKVTLRMNQVTPHQALQKICEKCEPPAVLKERDGIYYILPKS
jgi:type II secretory pathway component HofQ